MENIMIEFIGYTAGLVYIITMMPQIIKTYKLKKAEDVSFLMVIIFAFGSLLWTFYGYLISDMPILIMDAIAFVITIVQIVLIIRYKK